MALAAAFMAGAARAEEPKANAAPTNTLKSVYGEMPLPSGCKEGIFPLRTVKRIGLKLQSGQAAYLILPTKAAKDRSADGTSASVGRAGRITRSNNRDWPGWI